MAAPMGLTTFRMLRKFPRIWAAANGHVVTPLQSLIVKPQIRLIASRVTAKGLLEGTLQDGVGHQDNPSPATTAAEVDETARGVPIIPERAHQEMLLLQKPEQPPDAHILKVAIIGSPNAGKSTLINRLMGQRVCSVSSKVHTTRSNALAVLTRNNTQIVLLDTPGMVNHKQGRKHNLARSLLIDPKNSLDEADLALVLVDASNEWTREKMSNEILMSLHLHPKVSSILVLNKVDLISSKQELFSLTAQLTEGIIEGHKFTLDDRTARQLGKVETRPLLSHKYKPRLPKDEDSGNSLDELERTENVDHARMDATERSDDDIATNSQNKQGNVPNKDFPETEQFEVEPRDCSDAEPNSSLETQGNSFVRNNAELPSLLMEYVQNLESFSSTKDDSELVQPPIDLVEVGARRAEKEQRRRLLQEVDKRNGWDRFEAVFMVSALDKEGLEDVKEHLASKAVPGNWEYHRDVVTNLSPEEILREAIREKLLEYLPQEVPYNITQRNDLWTTEENGRLRIIQKIVCHKKSHVKLMKKNIGRIARESEQSLMSAFHVDVYLSLRIKLI